MNNKSPAIAALASFVVPGLGQAYNGEIGKAALFFLLTTICLLTIVFWIFPWALGIYDAYETAKN